MKLTEVRLWLDRLNNQTKEELSRVHHGSTHGPDVGEETQASIDVLTHIDNFYTYGSNRLTATTSGMTRVHDQGSTYLCHSYATMSAFRQLIIQFRQANPTVGSRVTRLFRNLGMKSKIDGTDEHSFHRMLSVFLGCVNPRSYFGDETKQAAILETVISRLVNRTTFEIEGWKRIVAVRTIFKELLIKIDDYVLTSEHVDHPTSQWILPVLESFLGQGKSFFTPAPKSFQVHFAFLRYPEVPLLV